jgi:SAM-dependent methyltransferase
MTELHDYYCSVRATHAGDSQKDTIYSIWERGDAFNDSVTPSTYSNEYRSHMVLKLLSLSQPREHVFSIGCGNGFVEGGVTSAGRHVQAIDCHEEAVRLTGSKGVDAFTADFFELPEDHLSTFSVVYADGLLGHMFHRDEGLDPFFEQLARLRPRAGTWLVFSNDAPIQEGVETAAHPSVSGFWYLSKSYLAGVLARFGYENFESYYFPYVRPISGLRNRTICVARVPRSPAAE